MAIKLGYCTASQILQALNEQRFERSAGTNRLIGQILISNGSLTEIQLDDVLSHLREGDMG